MITGAIVVTPPTGSGAAGAPPIVGPMGQSAYQLAVAAGYAGTLAQWLASLQGVPGATGSPGTAGATGAPGAALSVANLPTTLPAMPGVLWNNGGQLAVS